MKNNRKIASNGPKKTSIGNGKYSKYGNKGGGGKGTSRPSKTYRKKPRGQGTGRRR